VKRLLPWRIATLLLALTAARTAFAGGTGTSSGGDEAGGDSSSDGAASSETTEDQCETCPPNTSAGAIEFSDLEHGNPPAGERLVEVSAAAKCSCSECMCFDDMPTQIRLELDGDEVGDPCDAAQCEFTVVLTPGEHELTAIATYNSGDEVTETVPLLVPSDGGTTETGTPMQAEPESSGCGCTTPATGHPLALLAMLALFAIPSRRW